MAKRGGGGDGGEGGPRSVGDVASCGRETGRRLQLAGPDRVGLGGVEGRCGCEVRGKRYGLRVGLREGVDGR